MLMLEHALDGVACAGACRHSYSRTGNHLKELVYYIRDRDEFLLAFNAAVEGHPRYPIEITFFEDPNWEDYVRVLQMLTESD